MGLSLRSRSANGILGFVGWECATGCSDGVESIWGLE